MPPTDVISRLRAELDKLSGPARTGALVRLGQALAERYWRTGPGSPAALPDLNAAIDALNEAYGYFDPADPFRGHVAAQLGWLLSARNTAHSASEHDQETGIQILEEALTFPSLVPAIGSMARIGLGLLYFSRAAEAMRSIDVAFIRDGAPPGLTSDANRAAECFRAVLSEAISKDFTDVAQTLLTTVEAMQTLMGGLGAGGLAGLDLSRMMEAMAMLQKLQEQMSRGGAAGFGSSPGPDVSTLQQVWFAGADALAALDPLDRPVAVVQGPEPPSVPPTQRIGQPPAAAPVDHGDLRRTLHAKLAAVTSDSGAEAEVWAGAAALLLPTAPLPPVDVVDDLVALASMVVEGDGPADTATTGIDQFVLAVSFYLRDRVDDGPDDADRVAGAESLLTAARTVPPDHPAAIVILRALGAFLDERRPLGGVPDAADGFTDCIDAVIAAGTVRQEADFATLYALRCLCRAASSDTDGTAVAADLQRAVETVPVDYPWSAQLKAAIKATHSTTKRA
jgi:hypothetical protein